jgi:lipooligosaccharide transport system ATP-binding protein
LAAIELQGVRKSFGPITAVDGLDLDVPEGTCLGLLGPNGAGKSTTMRLLTGQARADEGQITVLGRELPREAKEARAEMGVVPQLDNLDVDVAVEDNLAAAYSWRAGSCTTRASCCSTSRPSASTLRSVRSSGR